MYRLVEVSPCIIFLTNSVTSNYDLIYVYTLLHLSYFHLVARDITRPTEAVCTSCWTKHSVLNGNGIFDMVTEF